MEVNETANVYEAPEDVDALWQKIEHWRKTRSKLCAMPEPLWKEAVTLAQVHGVYSISRELRLNYENLKNRVEKAEQQQCEDADHGTEFVEMDATHLFPKAEHHEIAEVELQGADGSKLSIRLPAKNGVDLVGLVKAFLRGGS